MSYCPFCLQQAEGDFCSHCGGSLHYQAGDTQLPVGSIIGTSGKCYIIGAARGQGGFGITYAALDKNKGCRVAVKEYFPIRCALRDQGGTVLPKAGMEEEFQKGFDNFCKEANRLVGIKPLASIVHIMDNILMNHTAYLVMEFLDGMPLHQKLSEYGSIIPAQELLPRLLPLMQDLEKLHQQGVLHRDISPDNILWMRDGTLKLIDFGSSRSMEGDRSMTIMLKPGFAPVEQYLTHGQGPWTDVYGLGATIYYCLTGIMPPPALERLEQDTVKSPTSLGAAVSPEEEQAILKAMETQPQNRFRSIREFESALFQTDETGMFTEGSGYQWDMSAWNRTGTQDLQQEAATASQARPSGIANQSAPIPDPDRHKQGDNSLLIGIAGTVVIVILILLFFSILL